MSSHELESVQRFLHNSSAKPNCDAVCKQLLGHPLILGWIFKGTTEEFSKLSPEEIENDYIRNPMRFEELNPEDHSIPEQPIIHDKAFRIVTPPGSSDKKLQIVIEAQNSYRTNYQMRKRMLYNACRAISAQKGTEFQNSNFDHLIALNAIWLFINPPARKANSIRTHRMFPDLFPIGGSRITEVFLGDPDTLDKPDLIKLLSGLFSIHWSAEKKCQMLENEFNFPETDSLREEIESMCNFSE